MAVKNSLYKLSVIVLRLRLDRPMSVPVVTAVGKMRILMSVVRLAGDLRVVSPCRPLNWSKLVGEDYANERRADELHAHVARSDEQWIGEAVVLL